ncbi:MAG: hypothetical protein ACI9X4_002193 [Glaciecola sp.]|jgi:hypothetical protein
MPPFHLPSTLSQADISPWRAILQLGMGLVFMIVGGVAAVGFYGPSIMGSALASSHFSSLNGRIRGVLEHEQSNLPWVGESHIKGLTLTGGKQEILSGSLHVPGLLDWWSEGLIPGKAHVDLDLLNLTVDPSGHFNLLENLVAKAGVSKSSPFFDRDLLNAEVRYWGNIEELVFVDQRSAAEPQVWQDSTFDVSWSPDGMGTLKLTLGGDQLEINLNWEGMGATFSLASLRGEVKFDGDSSALEALLGFPGGITNSMADNSTVRLKFAGEQGAQGGTVPLTIVIADASIKGVFDGSSFKMIPGAMPASLGMRRYAGLNALLNGLTEGLPAVLKDKVGFAIGSEDASWTWMLKGLETGVTPVDASLPFLEGLLASSRLDLSYRMTRGLTLSPKKNTGESLDLGSSTLDWSYDPVAAKGTGKLTASTPLEPNVANLVLGVNNKLRKGFELDWSGTSPMPSVDAQLESANLSHTLTSFYSSYLPSWGGSLPGVLGASCSLEMRRLDPNSPADKHGGLVPSWMAKVSGAKSALGDDFTFYVGDGVLWMDPGQTKSLALQPGRHAGIYDVFFSRFLPWFELLKVNGMGFEGGELLVEVSNLVFRGENLSWQLDEGFVELPQMDDVDYQIKRGWVDVWGDDEGQALEPIAFEVAAGKVTYEDLLFPVGTFQGQINLENGVVDLHLTAVNPLFALLPGDFKDFAKGVKVTGSVRDPECSKLIDTPNEDS